MKTQPRRSLPDGDAACLAHELAHAERHAKGIERPDYLLEEAEASIHASFVRQLRVPQRRMMIEDAREGVERWLREA